MNDDELPLNAELASAYLDDELDPAERASVETDPDVMSMVDSFSRVRAFLIESADVDAGARSTAIAAALAEFDARDVPSVAPPIAAATVMSLQSRRMRAYRVVTRVAAVLVIGLVVAVAALNASRSNDAKSSSASDNTVSAAADSATKLPQLKVAAADQTAGSTAAAATGGAAVENAPSAGPAINTREQLIQYAAQLESGSSTPASAAPSAQTPGGSGSYSQACVRSDQTVLGPIVFQGKAAFVARNRTTDTLQAVDLVNCHVLLDAGP